MLYCICFINNLCISLSENNQNDTLLYYADNYFFGCICDSIKKNGLDVYTPNPLKI